MKEKIKVAWVVWNYMLGCGCTGYLLGRGGAAIYEKIMEKKHREDMEYEVQLLRKQTDALAQARKLKLTISENNEET